MEGEKYISEREFREAERASRDKLAAAIQQSGLSCNHIARGSRVERRTVSRAAKGLGGVRADSAARIEYYLQNRIGNE